MSGVSLTTVIVAHDSLAELRRTLPPLVSQLGDGDELIIVDNASRDGLAAELGRLAPRARLIELGRNVGFAAGVNAGAAVAAGDLLVLLNPDALVAEGWADAIRAPWAGPDAAWMGLVLLEDGRHINTGGGVLHFTGFGWAGQIGQPAACAGRGDDPLGFLSGACLAIRRERWEALGGFAERFFMYCEDVDLSLRLRLTGATLSLAPDARVSHRYEFAKGAYKWRLLERNRWATIVRCYPGRLLALISPVLIVAELAVWLAAARERWLRMKALATLDLVRELPRLVGERRRIQADRVISPARFAEAMTADLSSPYLGDLAHHPLVTRALRVYWRLVGAALARG